MTPSNNITFLCGVTENWPDRLANGMIALRNGEMLKVSPNDPGLSHVLSGRRRMIIVKGGVIWAVYSRPRIKLLRKLERGDFVTAEVLELYSPRYINRIA